MSSCFTKEFRSWGGQSARSASAELFWRTHDLPETNLKFLPYGMGRSYGDSCLLNEGCMLETRRLNHLLAFDPNAGILRCEAGCSLAELLSFLVPRGWFVPVTPGTKFVTVGGCIANDVHGKNHHGAGTFGCFVTRFALRRSDGGIYECSPTENPELFRATIGGLGLTGLLLWVEFRLKKIPSPWIRQHTEMLEGVDSFFDVATREEGNYEYTVAWLDATHTRSPRGVFIAGNHGEKTHVPHRQAPSPRISLPVTLPNFALGSWSIRLLNRTYYTLNGRKTAEKRISYDPFFYPLDAVDHWNRAYGKKGLAQYQFVVPMEHGRQALTEVLGKVQAAKQTSFLTVVKLFGSIRSPGMLSFPRPGVTVCFDFPFLGKSTETLLTELDKTVFAAGGALYPAKDARMSPEAFRKSFPEYEEFALYVDPAFASNFAKRVALIS